MSATDPDALDPTISTGEYCRRIEAHLCQRNSGHLVRLVGPTFEAVCRWEALGVPLKVAFRGIDRYCERYYSKGPRRRPVRIEFCEADVLDAFDVWRRAVGLTTGSGAGTVAGPDESVEAAPRRGPSLPTHLDRVLLKLSSFLAGTDTSPAFRDLVERALGELDALRHGARGLRGAAREGAVARLRQLDEELTAEALRSATPEMLAVLQASADAELRAFRARMSDAAWAQAVAASMREALRERLNLPRIAMD